MKKQLFLIFFIVFTIFYSAAAKPDSITETLGKNTITQKSFAELDAYLAKSKQEFDNSEETIRLFNKERNRLGANFESELWKYLSSDLNKHYWISSFVEYEDYLQGNKPLPQLAFKIKEKGVELKVADDDYPGLGMKFSMRRDMAVELYLVGKRNEAIAQKKKAEIIYKEIKDYGVVGATTEYVMCIYDNLEGDTSICKKEATEN